MEKDAENSTELLTRIALFGDISREDIENYRLYTNEFLQEYFDHIMHKLIADDANLQAIYERHPIRWVISEQPKKINAEFVHKPIAPFFCIWRELLNFIDNEDQLAFIMGHELEHYYQEMKAIESEDIHKNSHIEETMADINGLERVAAGGYNIEAARSILDKFRKLKEQAESESGRDKKDIEFQDYLALLDPHAKDTTRESVADAKTSEVRHKLAAGMYAVHGNQGVDANTIPVHEWTKEFRDKLNQTNYISYVDQRFKEAGFDTMSTDEKNDFLVDMCIEVGQSKFAVRKVDFIRHVVEYLTTLNDEMHRWSVEEKERRFRDGSAPAMSLIAKFIEKTVLNPSMEISEEDIYKIDELYYKSLGIALELWPSEVRFEGNAKIWQQIRNEIAIRLDRAQKKQIPEQATDDKEDIKDAAFVHRLCDLLSSRGGRFTTFDTGPDRWADMPCWDKLKKGDRYPTNWLHHFYRNFTHRGVPIGYTSDSESGVHRIIRDKFFANFIRNSDGSICASAVLKERDANHPEKISDTVDMVWSSWIEYELWQEQKLKEYLHEQIAAELHDLKQRADAFIRGEGKDDPARLEALDIDFFGDIVEFARKLFPALPTKDAIEAMCLDPNACPNWKEKYWPRIWLDEEELQQKLKPVKFDRELLISKMPPEDVEFFTHPQVEYSDKLVDAYIEWMGLKKVSEFDKKYGFHEHDYWPFPHVASNSEQRAGIACTFLPYQQERLIDAYIKRAPTTLENLHELEASGLLLSAYQNLFSFYYTKNGKNFDYDFSDFKTPIPAYILRCFNLPELKYENIGEWQEFIKGYPEKDIPFEIQCVVFDTVMHNKGERLPLVLLKDLMLDITGGEFLGIIHEIPIFEYKVKELARKPENWPKSLDDFVSVVDHLRRHNRYLGDIRGGAQEQEQYDAIYEVIKEGFIKRVEKERDVKKIENAWLIVSDYLSVCTPNPKEYDELLVPFLVNSSVWKQDIKSKIDFFTRISDHCWGSDVSVKNNMAAKLLDEIGQIKDPQERESLLFELIKKKGRLSNTDLLDQAQRMWVKSVGDIMGKPDDESEEYLAKIKPYINKIKRDASRISRTEEEKTVLKIDQDRILRYLAEEVVSQKRLSQEIKPKAFSLRDQTAWQKTKQNLVIMGSGGLGTYLSGHPERRDDLINFLRSNGTLEDCRKIRSIFVPEFDDPNSHISHVKQCQLSLSRIQEQYKTFWASDPDVQMAIVDAILRNTATEPTSEKPLWEQNFSYVADQIFPGDNQQSKALKIALHAYIKSRPPDQQNFGLAKLLVASGIKTDNANEEDANQKIGKGIKMFLESIGPAGIKLGQALAAVPDIPKYIRDNLSDFTSNIARPARWEIYDWLDVYKEQNPNEAEHIDAMKLGKILGSASFFVTLSSGDKEVIKCLRLAAQVEADQEMGYIYDALKDVLENNSEILGDLGPTLLRIIQQAKDSIAVETDLNKGEEQFKLAKEIYPDSVTVNNIKFDVHQAEWKKHGDKWAELEKMDGVEIDKIQDPEYKKSASVAYVSVELLNIFSGKQFDFDRHIGQMKINQETNTLGLFDTGSMLLDPPSVEDQRALGTILYRTMENAFSTVGKKNPSGGLQAFASCLTEEIDNFYKASKQPSAYITQVQRGLLALSGYYKDFSLSDFAQCMDIAFNNQEVKVSEHIMSAFVSEMLDRTGLLKKVSDPDRVPKEIAVEKENMGRMIFNLMAASQSADPNMSFGEVLEEEVKVQGKSQIPVLGKFFLKSKNTDSSFRNIKIPSCFACHIVEALKDKQIDPIIAKGAMKEAYDSICLLDKNNRDTPETKKKLGKELYTLFISAKGKGQSQEEIKNMAKQRLQGLVKESVLARNLYCILSLSEYVSSKEDLDLKEVVWEIIGQDNLDKDILAGIRLGMKENHQTFASLTLSLLRPISRVRKIRNVFSLFKKQDRPQKNLRTVLEKTAQDISELPKQLGIKETAEGALLTFLSNASVMGIPLARENRSIVYGDKKKSSSQSK